MNKQGGEKIKKIEIDVDVNTVTIEFPFENGPCHFKSDCVLAEIVDKVNEIIDYLNHAKTK